MRKSQKQKVLDHMREHGNITSLTAFYQYNITRLSGLIYILRNDGFNITSHSIPNENGGHHARYELHEKQRELEL